MEITHLGSGSRGNATLLQTDEAKVSLIADLVDAKWNGDWVKSASIRRVLMLSY